MYSLDAIGSPELSSAVVLAPRTGRVRSRRGRGRPVAADNEILHAPAEGATLVGNFLRAPNADLAELVWPDLVADDLAIERLGIDGEQGGRLAAVTVHLPQRDHDVLSLHRFETRAGGADRRRGGRGA